LFTADVRAVGVNVPGIPSILIGRNDYVAAGVTNQYGDAQDLYIETVDPNNPDHYLHGELSIPFEVIEESIKIKDDNAPNGVRNEKLQVRLTARGPVISNLHKDLSTDKVITVRWSPLESMQPSLGIDMLLRAQSVTDIKASLTNFTAVHLNYVFADVQGGVGWQTTGKLPIRARGNGTIPMQVLDGEDNWMGWIPYPEMPQRYDAPRGWLGTANHKTVTQDYPYYYSNWFSPANRYQRIMELLDTPNIKTVADHWQFMRDDLNVTARDISPIFVKALSVLDETTELAEILAEWDFREKVDSIATSIYQQTYRNLVALVFKDELGEMLGDVFISNNYFWQERFGLMLKQRESDWFDDITTKENTETLTELIQAAGLKTIADLSTAISPDPQQWQWGKIHQIEFVNPIRRKGVGKDWLGGGNYAMAGSGDTLLRALYPLNKQGNLVAYSAALRMVVDLSDPDKVLAVSPGGISGRTFTAHFKDQIPAYMNGEKRYWWFSDKEIDKHAVSRLYLQP
jgi:penicillin amidase